MTHHRNLPTKICEVCRREFAWRKKWENVWNDVKYCSERCRRSKAAPKQASTSSKPPVSH
ncbi:DUF2256 domain-containing protein [Planctopirus ephydatiae]|uniref:DUF2256 domain-containing protein n=1 Tax=Planctopirus ephydatiae TaxID=2528019 RepID=UPI0011A0567B|nr:DUF2256 domain-containing protein [Planctopirus ephydatiae]